ncbi:MAG: HlyD family efflux transporter periplasmic adaptor subunit [Planctomycetota bacterium]
MTERRLPDTVLRRTAPLTLAAAALLSCDGEPIETEGPAPRAITVQALVERAPRRETLVPAVVEPYRRSQLSFDVAGLVMQATEVGMDVNGPQLDGDGGLLLAADGQPVQTGDVVAALETTRYEQAVTAAELAIATTQSRIESTTLEIDTVLAARTENARATLDAARADVAAARDAVAVAQAELELAVTTVERDRSLIGSGAVAQSVLDQSESGLKTATANRSQANANLTSALQGERSALASVDEAEGSSKVRIGERDALRAELAEKQNELARARTDLNSCRLLAPFSGRVTQRFTAKGTYVSAGQPVVELTLQSPVKVVVTASAAEERELPVGTAVPIYLDGGPGLGRAPVLGTVFEKTSVADAATRTFRIALIAPNQLHAPPTGAGRLAAPTDVFPVITMPDDPDRALFVNVGCIVAVRGAPHVLRLPSFQTESRARALETLQIPERVPIELADDWAQVDAWTLRRVAGPGRLQSGDALVLNPTADDLQGVRVGSLEFALRIGDVVRVGLDVALPPVGLWIAVSAIVARAGAHQIFVVDDGHARAITVDVHEASGDQRRITAEGLATGAQVVLDGVHYLSDGDPVTVTSRPSSANSR